MSRAVRMLLAALVAALGVLALGAGPASASVRADDVTTARTAEPCGKGFAQPCAPPPPGGQCATAPDPESPLDGLGSQLPHEQTLGPAAGKDPSMYVRYGYAGLAWTGYDVGYTLPLSDTCLPNADSVQASMGASIANGLFSASQAIVAAGDSLLHAAYNVEWLQIFDPFIERSVTNLHDRVFVGWIPLAFAVLGVVLLLRARKAALASTATVVGGAMVALICGTYLFTAPLFAAHTFDNTVTGATSDIASAINGSSPSVNPASGQESPGADHALAASVHDALLYQAWLAGSFGSADSPTAKKYGATLFDARALTWDEAKVVRAGGPAATALINAKKQKFIDTANAIKKDDPTAYSYLQGKHVNQWVFFAFMSLVGAIFTMPLIITASLAMMSAFLIARIAIVVTPIYVVLAVVRQSIGLDLVDRVVSIAATALVWSIGLPIAMLLDKAALTAPNLSNWIRLALLALISFAMFMTLVGLSPGFGGVLSKKHAREGHRWLTQGLNAAAAWVGANLGARAAVNPPPPVEQEPPEFEVDPDVEPWEFYAMPEGEDWTREPVEGTDRQALPVAPVTADSTETASERDQHTLVTKERADREAAWAPEPRDDMREGDVYVEDDGTEVYDIYSGVPAPRVEDDDEPDVQGPWPVHAPEDDDNRWETLGDGARWHPERNGDDADDADSSVSAGADGDR